MRQLIYSLLVTAVFAACNPSRDQGQNKVAAWQSTYDSLSSEFHNLQNVYARDTTSYSPEFQSMFNLMQKQWIQMQALHQQMAGGGMMGRGMMNGNGGMMNGRNMGNSGSMGGGMNMMRFRQMSQQMLSYCDGMSKTTGLSGRMAAMLNQMRNRQQQLLNELPADTAAAGPSSGNANSALTDGAQIFNSNCAACHGANAEGMAGIFPPLNGSPVIKGDKEILLKVVLNGLQGEVKVNGTTYSGMMPSFRSMLSSDQLADVLTYLRNLPNNKASSVSAGEVSKTAKATSGHTGAYTPQELGLEQ